MEQQFQLVCICHSLDITCGIAFQVVGVRHLHCAMLKSSLPVGILQEIIHL